MAEHAHTLTTTVPAETVWEFVRDMDHWAPFLLGYQAHAKKSDDESIWTIKADVGAMSRTVDFRVHITEWAEPERIRFTLEGIGEPDQGVVQHTAGLTGLDHGGIQLVENLRVFFEGGGEPDAAFYIASHLAEDLA